MSSHKGIAVAFAGLGKAGNPAEHAQRLHGLVAPGKDLMRIALMTHVKNQPISAGMKYPVYFDGAETAAGASNMSAQVLIPIADIPEDINNGRLVVVVQEHDKRDADTIEREGFATFYASVQITSPKITYQYSRDTNELMMQAISTVAGIKSNTYDIGAGEVSYTVPFDVGAATTITLKAVDNVGNVTTEVLDADSLDLNGGAGGSLPTEDSSGSELNTYYISGRSAEVYIMGGTRNNTTNVPSSEVLEMILGTP